MPLKEPRNHPCIDCGKAIHRIATRCLSCSAKHQWKTGVKGERALLNLRHGKRENNPAWKGGRIKYGKYTALYMPEHTRANQVGYVFEHIIIWEKANDKSLPDKWVIHHLNGVKTDNRPRNLVALSSQKHFLVLAAKAKRIQELEALLNGQLQLM